jgi:hypothetical protein
MMGVMVGSVAARRNSAGEVVRSVLLVLAFTIVPLVVLMVRQVRSGAWQNIDASNTSERPVLYVVGGLTLIALVAYLALVRPQSYMLRGAAATFVMLAACALATRWIKVSLHMAFAALATTTLLLIGSRVGWVLLPVVPALAWSRLSLARHRPVEVALGTLIGVSTGLAVVLI